MDIPILTLAVAVQEPLVRAGIASALEAAEMRVVSTPESSGALLAACRDTPLSAVIADERLLDDTGSAGLEELCRLEVPVLLYVETSRPEHVAALRYGAAGFIQRGADVSVVVECVQHAASGQLVLDADTSRALFARQHPESDRPLTPKETDVLRLVAADLSARDIADALYMSESTVKSHLSSARAKLGCRKSGAAALRALELGLIPPPRRSVGSGRRSAATAM